MIHIARHGQSIANLENTLAGSIDSELTMLGEQQAKELANQLETTISGNSLVISSPLKRAYYTAKEIAKEL